MPSQQQHNNSNPNSNPNKQNDEKDQFSIDFGEPLSANNFSDAKLVVSLMDFGQYREEQMLRG